MKVLVISSEFPNQVQRTKAIFIGQQIAKLAALCDLKVIAPVPWSPPVKTVKKWHIFSQVPATEVNDGIDVFHPRYLVIPKVGRCLYGVFYFLGIYKTAKNLLRDFSFDIILAYFAYPDGFAAALLAKAFKKPLIIKVLGSDINLYIRSRMRRFLTAYALRQADKVIAVSNDLKSRIVDLGVAPEKIEVVPNGVDTVKFTPQDKHECRKKLSLNLDKKIVLFIGSFRKVKGIDDLIAAFAKLSNANRDNLSLVLLGDGELREEIKENIHELNLESRIKLQGAVPYADIGLWLNASDVFCLPSLNEGCPNVLLEALACGVPVVATRVGGIPEIINSDNLGILVSPHDPEALAGGILRALNGPWQRRALRKRVENATWQTVAGRIFDVAQDANRVRK